MTDRPVPPIPSGILTEEQIAAISGGSCGINDYMDALGRLREAYDELVDFTSYVIERTLSN